MGQLKEALKLFNDEELENVREHVKTLFDLGKARAKVAELELTNRLNASPDGDHQTVPISHIIDTYSAVHAYNSAVTDRQVLSVVMGPLEKIAAGGSARVRNVIGTQITDIIRAFLNHNEELAAGQDRYFVLTDGPSIIKLDLRIWATSVNARDIREKIEKILVVSAVKSSIDIQKINLNIFISLYQSQLSRSSLSPHEIIEEITQATEIIRVLKDFTKPIQAM
ncbi:hypothetical protein [Pseudomonas asplenii]|uniref:hypothetical protein n=1 Tax=Pseudomonas asplenii TaxID=53407 RepID=UPI00037ABC3F|nr:hypothetical protein [Pseudomonas fuscovaginae]